MHTTTGTSGNVHDLSETSKLLQEDDHVAYSNSGYLGAPDLPEIKDDETLAKIEFRINKRPSSLKTADTFKGLNRDKMMEHDKFSVRSKIEHTFLIVKKQIVYARVAYRGIGKNMEPIQYIICQCQPCDVYQGGSNILKNLTNLRFLR